jgi:hypothetical protein
MKLMASSILVTFLIAILMESPKAQIISHWDKDSSYYLYQAVDEYLIPNKITFDHNFSKREILDSIAGYLTNKFFIKRTDFYKDKKNIVIAVQKLTSIVLTNRKLDIATINIIDPDEVCMTTFFQGTTGAFNTYLALVSNFIQPQLSTPLLDCIVFTYNGDELKAMDHINLEGIISEREINNIVRMAIKD